MKDELQIAWFAGLFEGEGCINLIHTNSVRLELGTTDQDIAQKCIEATGVGKVYGPRACGENKPVYIWSVQWKPEVVILLNELLPYLGERRSMKAMEALERLAECHDNKRVAECGTKSGYNAHRRRGEDPCDSCKDASYWYHKGLRDRRVGEPKK